MYNIYMIDSLYLTSVKPLPIKTFGEAVQEICVKTEPKPLFCELPGELKLKFSYQGTTATTYTTTSSLASGTAFGTTTTTTL